MGIGEHGLGMGIGIGMGIGSGDTHERIPLEMTMNGAEADQAIRDQLRSSTEEFLAYAKSTYSDYDLMGGEAVEEDLAMNSGLGERGEDGGNRRSGRRRG